MPKLPRAQKPTKDTPMEGLSLFGGGQPPDDAEPDEPVDTPVGETEAQIDANSEATRPEPTKASYKRAAAKKSAPKAQGGAKVAPGGADEFGFAALDETTEFLNLLLYGREGTSKTTSLADAANLCPDGSRILVVAAEGGLKKTALRKRGIDTSKIVIWPDPKSGIWINNKTLEKLHEKLLGDLMDNPTSWYLVGIDSISEVVTGMRELATDKRIAKLFADTKVDNSMIDEDFVDRDDYGVMTNQLRKLIRKYRDLPCHFILTALERVDDKTGVVGPSITPALAGDILGYVDMTLYCRASQHATGEDEDTALAEFRALTRQGSKTRAKDRFDATPRVLVEPTFSRILGYVREELAEATDPLQIAYVQRREQEAAEAAAAAAAKEQEKAAKKPAKTAAKKATTNAA